MLLIHILKILFWILIIRHSIRWVSYHIHHRNNKARVFHGNTRMPMDVELALMNGIYAKTKTRFKFKDLSYRKSLVEWMCILNSLYPPDNLTVTRPPYTNLVTPKSPKGDFSLELFTIGNRKPFPQLETRKDGLIVIKKPCNLLIPKPFAKNNSVSSATSRHTKILKINNLKILKSTIPFPEQTFACTHPIFTI
jgi:hypothetical protein